MYIVSPQVSGAINSTVSCHNKAWTQDQVKSSWIPIHSDCSEILLEGLDNVYILLGLT